MVFKRETGLPVSQVEAPKQTSFLSHQRQPHEFGACCSRQPHLRSWLQSEASGVTLGQEGEPRSCVLH